MTTRRPRWHPPPPPSPKIIHLPRRIRRAKTAKPEEQGGRVQRQGKLGSLFDQERAVSRGGVPVFLLSSSGESAGLDRDRDVYGDGEGRRRGIWGGNEEEKWRFQAEFLRAECHFLRMEREIALKKLERNRAQTEKAMKSAVKSLIMGRDKVAEGENAHLLLEEEIEELEEKLEELQRRSPGGGGRDCEARKCCNVDKKASVLRRRMEKQGSTEEELDEEKRCVKEIRELAEASLTGRQAVVEKPCHLGSDRKSRLTDVETIRRKMEGLSKEMLERMEEYGGLLGGGITAAADSAGTSRKTEFLETEIRPQERRCGEDKGVCSGRCKSIVKKIVDQVRAETEQWSQLQAMLSQVREEMVELQTSRDSWQRRAIDSHSRLQSTRSDKHEWKQRAKCAEARALELHKQISELQTKLQRLRSRPKNEEKLVDIESAWGLAKMEDYEEALDSQKEKEKHVLICRLKENLSAQKGKENKEATPLRSRMSTSSNTFLRQPLREVGNSSSPLTRKGRAVLSLLHPEPSRLVTI